MVMRFLFLAMVLLGHLEDIHCAEFLSSRFCLRRLSGTLPQPYLQTCARWSTTVIQHAKPFKIIHPCTDYGFKHALKSPDIAIGFINHVLDLKGSEAVKSVTYIDPHLPSEDPIGKNLTVDVLCYTDQGKFLVEMQNHFLGDYPDKAWVELCRLVGNWDSDSIPMSVKTDGRSQLRAGKKHNGVGDFWQNIKRTIVLVVSNREFKPTTMKSSDLSLTQMEPNVINTYRMTHDQYHGRFLGDMDARVVLMMLGNFKKQEQDLRSETDRWMYLFKDESLKYGVSRIPTFKEVRSLSRVASNNRALQHFYEILDSQQVPQSALSRYQEDIGAVNKTLELLKDEGRAEGRIDVLRKMVQRKKSKDKTIAQISAEMDITEADVQNLLV